MSFDPNHILEKYDRRDRQLVLLIIFFSCVFVGAVAAVWFLEFF